jgi:transposase InsO family protein
MPWKERDTVSLRREFVHLARSPEANMAELCRRFGVSRKTGYKWLARYEAGGADALADRSRRPRSSPGSTSPEMEGRVLAIRRETEWGGRKIHHRLIKQGFPDVPAPSTITGILRRHDEIDPVGPSGQGPWTRFCAEAPNDLWQMDFKGHVPAGNGRCHPLDVLDDHSRFVPCLAACADELGGTVQARLTGTFRRYGLPRRMLMDNGPPWSAAPISPYTALSVWLMRLGIQVSHGRAYHPQTQGKLERFHRTLKAEILQGRPFADLAECQREFDRWRAVYNLERPHEALGMAVPASRYRPSPRPFPEVPAPIEYGPDDAVRRVQGKGEVHFRGGIYRVGKAFHGQPVALRATGTDGVFDVVYVRTIVATVDLRD